jgi:hypothetical protein
MRSNRLNRGLTPTLAYTDSDEKHREPLSMGGGRVFPSSLPGPGGYIVEFEGPGDPEHPYNWSLGVKQAYILRSSRTS